MIKLRRMRFVGHGASMGETRYKVLFGKPEGERPLEAPRCGWEDNINIT
jgi:hypothetical protein